MSSSPRSPPRGRFETHVDTWLSGVDPAFSKKLGDRGWLGMTWPKKYGGHERSAMERYAVTEELLAAGAPVAAHWIADRQSGPNLLRYGTEEQRQEILPRIAAGECFFVIGMSEPDSGSDLASIRTRAVRDRSGDWVVNGAKVWTSNAHHSHYAIVLVRTSPAGHGATGTRGCRQLLVDLSLPGITINPIRILDGGHHFNEVVFDDVVVPGDMLLGEEGNGWHQVTAELAFERSGPERFLSTIHLSPSSPGGLPNRVIRPPRGPGPVVGPAAGAAADVAADRGGAGPRRAARHPGRAGQGRGDDVRGATSSTRSGRWSTCRRRWTRPIRWAGRWPRRSCTRRATRCAAGPTRSCGGSWRAGWGSDERPGPAWSTTVRDILDGFEPFVLTPERRWDAGLWAALAGAGLTGVGLPEEAGGSGGELADAVAIVRTLAAGAGAVPVAEQLLVAGPALLAAGSGPAAARGAADVRGGRRGARCRPIDDGDGPRPVHAHGTR